MEIRSIPPKDSVISLPFLNIINATIYKSVFRQFTLLCHALDLFSGELVAIDGTKIKGVNNISRNYTKPVLREKLKEINRRIEAYLKEIEETDGREFDRPQPTADEALKEKIDSLKAKKEEYKSMLDAMEQSGETQISLTDPDSRSFPKKFGVAVGYNAQTAVDEKHHLIVEQEVTNAVTDIDQLSAMAIKSKEVLGVERLKVVADAGYCNAKEIKACEEAGIEAYAPKINTSNSTKKGLYGKEQFTYDAEKNRYTCPAGKTLSYRFEGHEKRRGIKRVISIVGVEKMIEALA